MRNKITMHQAIFYRLYQARGQDPEAYTAIWQLIGEVYIQELGKWAFVSYEVAARMSEIYHGNPTLFERRMTRGKSGSKYYEYRIARNVSVEDIKDENLLSFYKAVKARSVRKAAEGVSAEGVDKSACVAG